MSSRRTPQRVLNKNQESEATEGCMDSISNMNQWKNDICIHFSSRRVEMEGKHAGHNNSMCELRPDGPAVPCDVEHCSHHVTITASVSFFLK